MTCLTAIGRLLLCVIALASTAPAFAQEFRATVTGRVSDPAGLAMPGVTVTAVNTQTNEVATTITSAEGVYSLPFLKPGVYKVNAELEGFSKYEQEKVELEVGQARTINIELQVGSLSEVVTVVSEAVEASKADRGMVIDNARVTELPLNARNPFMLSYLSPGITYNGPAIYQRPFDNGAIADWSINGGQNRNNEFLLDGAPNNSIQGGNNIAYVPPVDSVQEFKIVTNSYDAQYGRTSGGVVNVSLKSGTNAFHGTVYEFARRKAFDSNEYLFKINNREKPDHKLDQYGFQVDGPVRIPGMFDGRNKTFFMFNYEGYKEATPNPSTYTVPDEAQLRGDFSGLRDAQGRLIQIFDPATGRLENGQWVARSRSRATSSRRTASARWRGSSRSISCGRTRPRPPAPTPGGATSSSRRTSRSTRSTTSRRKSIRTSATVRRCSSATPTTSGPRSATPTASRAGPRRMASCRSSALNHTGVGDWVRTTGSSLVFNIRAGLNQYLELARSDPGLAFNPGRARVSRRRWSISCRTRCSRASTSPTTRPLGRQGRSSETTTGFSLQPNFSWTKGTHNIRGGLDMRLTWYTREINGNLFVMSFDRRFTQRAFNSGDALERQLDRVVPARRSQQRRDRQQLLSDVPLELLRALVPGRLEADRSADAEPRIPLGSQHAGLRGAGSAQFRLRHTDDQSGRRPNQPGSAAPGLVGSRRSRIRERGRQREIPVPVRLGQHPAARRIRLHAERPHDHAWRLRHLLRQRRRHLRLERLRDPDAADHVARRRPHVHAAVEQRVLAGRRRRRPAHRSASRRSSGATSTSRIASFVNPYVHQFSFGIQRALPWRTSLELTYVGSRTRMEQNRWAGFNTAPVELRNQCDPTMGGRPAFCNELLTNPFYQVPGFEGTARFTSPTLSRYELSRPYPQFGQITMVDRNDGKIWYNSAQLMINKRVSDGLTLTGTYTLSKMIEENGGGNQVGGTGATARLHRGGRHRPALAVSAAIARTGSRSPACITCRSAATAISSRTRTRSSTPSPAAGKSPGCGCSTAGGHGSLPANVFYVKDATIRDIDYSDPNTIRGVAPCVAQMSDAGVVTMQGFSVAQGCTEPNFIIRPNYTPRTTPYRDDQIRRPPFYQFDINFAKTFRFTSTMRLQVRWELYNVLDQVVYDERNYENNAANAAFGTIDRRAVRQSNFPRYGQLGLKLLF